VIYLYMDKLRRKDKSEQPPALEEVAFEPEREPHAVGVAFRNAVTES